jgi:DNA-binding XRE family transcriptional regulator
MLCQADNNRLQQTGLRHRVRAASESLCCALAARSGKTLFESPKDYRRAEKRIDVSIGDSVRIMRELQELSQNDLSDLTGIPQSTISAIERDRVNLGVERAKVLARALRCHPAVLVFPGWDVERESAA